jgi:hypothetical protein
MSKKRLRNTTFQGQVSSPSTGKEYGQNLLRQQYHKFLITEFQHNRMLNIKVITTSQAKHISIQECENKDLELQYHELCRWKCYQC